MSNRWNVLPFAPLSRLMANIPTGICAYSFHYFQSYFLSSLVPHQCPLSGNMNKITTPYELRAHNTQKRCTVVRLVRCIVYTIIVILIILSIVRTILRNTRTTVSLYSQLSKQYSSF